MLLLLLLLAVCGWAVPSQPPAMPVGCDKSKIVSCILTKMDTNHDDMVTIAEFDLFLNSTCGRFALGALSGESVIRHCDTNGDRMLSEADYEGPRACTASAALRRVICNKCDECNRLLEAEAAAAAATTAPAK